jgi:hypothetical protein
VSGEASVVITLALVCYTIGVWSARIQGRPRDIPPVQRGGVGDLADPVPQPDVLRHRHLTLAVRRRS